MILILAFVILSQSSPPKPICSHPTSTSLFLNNSQSLTFTTATMVNNENNLLSIYANIPQIQDYNIDLSKTKLIHLNKYPLCNKLNNQMLTFSSQKDLWICFQPYYQVTCDQLWKLCLKCGTFLQIHKPFDPEIIISLNLVSALWIQDLNNVKLTNVKIQGLCAGSYHIWLVFYSKIGKSVKNVKPIYINQPGCLC